MNSAVFPAVSGKGAELPAFAKEVKETKTFDIRKTMIKVSAEVHVLLPVFPGGNSELGRGSFSRWCYGRKVFQEHEARAHSAKSSDLLTAIKRQ